MDEYYDSIDNEPETTKSKCVKCHFVLCSPCRILLYFTPCKNDFDIYIDQFAENNYDFCCCKKQEIFILESESMIR